MAWHCMVNSRTARRVESILPGREVLFSEQSIVTFFFDFIILSSVESSLPLFPSVGDPCLCCSWQGACHKQLRVKWTCKITFIFHLPFRPFASYILLSNGLTFPGETWYQKPSQAKPMICCLSPFAFSPFFWLLVLISLLFYPICFSLSLRLCYCLVLPYPRIPASVSSPYLYVSFLFFSLYHTQPSLSGLVLHGWSHGGFLESIQ